MEERALPARAPLRAGIVAGIAGAVSIDVYMLLTTVYVFHAATFETFYRYVASAALGKVAYTAPQAVGLGIALHVTISVAWSLGYAYLAAQTPQVLARPLLSGVAFGIFVMIAMQLGEVLANIYALPNSFTLLNAFVGHVLFFGIPVAYIVTRFGNDVIAELTIDTAALRRNVRALGALAAPARYAAVVKGNAYGHGLVATARALESAVDAFCVYRADEALALRAAGIAAPLLVLGPVETRELESLHAAGAALTLWSEGGFRRDVARTAERRGAPFPVHAKIDTGVTRLGLRAERAASALADYLTTPELALRGVYTHLAAAEELESDYTLGQLTCFEAALEPVAARLAERGVMRHAAASAAAMLFPKLRLDLIRAGIATYGIWPSAETRAAASTNLELEPALSWTTELVVVRDVPAGQPVGYGCTFVTQRPSRIGVLPIGYAEGLPRALSNAGAALVHGRRAAFVGRVCMNMSFVDVTDVARARTGDRVTLVGRDGDAWLDANEFAAAAGTIGYELVARLPAEVPRRYVESAAIASRTSSVPS